MNLGAYYKRGKYVERAGAKYLQPALSCILQEAMNAGVSEISIYIL